MQSTFNILNGPARLSDLNDEFDDSDDSDNEISNIRQDNEQDFSLSMFASNGSMQTGRNAPNLSQYHSKSASPPIRDQMNFNQGHHSKVYIYYVARIFILVKFFEIYVILFPLICKGPYLQSYISNLINNILATPITWLLKPTSNPSAISTSIIPSMPEFLNDDLELSESDSDSWSAK